MSVAALSFDPHPDSARFRLAGPVTTVWRAAGVLQVGLEDGAFLLAGAPPGAPAAIGAFERWRTAPEVLALHPELDAAWLDRLLGELRSRGRLLSGPGAADEDEVGVIGAGRLARDLVRLLVAEGPVWVSDTAPRGLPEESARRRQGWRTLGQGAEHRVRLADHWRCALGRPARLVVVCPDTVEADRVQTDQLVRDRQPHLVVTADAERASVGPLVIPGATPCLRCHDLQRRATEPRWGDFVAELGRTRSIPAPFVRQWAASTAAAQVHAFAAGCVPDSAGGTVELSAGSGVLRARSWARHPDCGCGAPW